MEFNATININVRENRRGNQERTMQRNRQHQVNKTHDKHKQNKTKQKHTKQYVLDTTIGCLFLAYFFSTDPFQIVVKSRVNDQYYNEQQ
jgi:hypothetical protein